uniref:Uncharacterized protein n=1 Tax=Anguilla anguilla TaxID=7936 RepID=A0A0E9RNV8_ANGAN
MESYVCNGTYSSTTNKDRSENCFIYELDNIEKACCTTIGDTICHSVNELVYDVRRHAKTFYESNNYTRSSCEGFEPKTFKDYIKAFRSLVQRKIDMLHSTK